MGGWKIWVARAAWAGFTVNLILDLGGVFKVLLAAIFGIIIIWDIVRGVWLWRTRRRAD